MPKRQFTRAQEQLVIEALHTNETMKSIAQRIDVTDKFVRRANWRH